MASTMDKVKHALHLDKDKSHTSGTAEGEVGPHGSRVANAADPRVDSDMDGSRNAGMHSHNAGVTGTHTGTTAGPHSSNVGNVADPRVDSTTGQHTIGSGTTGYNSTGSNYATGQGPHDSSTVNKLDPRVDSQTGAHTIGSSSNKAGSGHTYGGATGTSGTYDTTSSGLTGSGPHDSRLANKVDPRVDSVTGEHSIGSNNAGATGTYSTTTSHHHNTMGNTGGISSSTNSGPHNSNFANTMDPTVDSKRTGHNVLGDGSHATPGSGTAQNTAGPHNADMLNKLDPRVDADLDGSKTYGGNKTYN